MQAPRQRQSSSQPPQPGNGGGHRGKDGNQRAALKAISAPYNFVPLSNWIFLPAWGKDVSHDIPFQDGLSGALHYTLTADTHLLVGGKQTKPGSGKPGEVKPFQLPDGRYAIPGSSLKGLLRSVVEIAGFGRMSKVDEVRPGLRDISTADSVYAMRVRGKVGTGFLRQHKDGSHAIIPCSMTRLNHRDLETALHLQPPIFKARQTVKDKYASWEALCAERQKNPQQLSFELGHPDATRLYEGSLHGVPVLTGQISDSTKPRGKHRDFVFYCCKPDQAIPVPNDVWRDFLRIHGDEDGKPGMSWPGYWKAKYRAGDQVPVFYVQDRGLLRIGLAYMPKLAGDFSTHDMICHTNPGHLQAPGAQHGYDLADLLFGAINGENQADALRGRVNCEVALAQGKPQTMLQPVTILNGPKPSYFPNYITQPADPNPKIWQLKPGQQYATYIESGNSKAPTLRGFKRYPVRPLQDTKVQTLTSEQEDNKKVQVVLHTLPPQTRFGGRIVFHNLKPVELGALLWALTWGGDAALRHSLGMGKPFGFGQVHCDLDLDHCRLIPNDPAQAETALNPDLRDQLMQQYREQMDTAVKGWESSLQMHNLLAMANPGSVAKLPEGMELRHMRLASRDVNEFQLAKQARFPLILADYAVATAAHDLKDYHPLQGKPVLRPAVASGSAALTVAAVKPADPPPLPEEPQHWTGVTLIWNKGSQTLEVRLPFKGSVTARLAEARALMDMLPQEQRARLEKRGEISGAEATVMVKGKSHNTLAALSWPASN